MGDVFYRGVNPSDMGYTELRYYGEWHKAMVDAEVKAYQNAQNKRGK